MIPFFQWMQIHIGPLVIQVWGLMVALGIVAGVIVALRVAQYRGLNHERVLDIAFWSILAGLIGGRLAYVFSEFSLYATAPLDILKVWEGGMSISGGLVGGLIAGVIIIRKYRLNVLAYAEALLIALPIGLGIGRLGCFFIYDHPGTPTAFFLGQEYLDGIVRHNHGLYLSITGFMLAFLFAWLWKRNPTRRDGTYTIVFLFWYGATRFVLDFFRATDLPYSDPRFFHLTVAQYLAIGMVALGFGIWYTLHQKSTHHPHGTATKT